MTESLGRPEEEAGTNTLPGMAARPVFEVMTAASVVFSRLALKGSAWMTRTGRRFAGLLPFGSPRPAQQMLPRRITTHPRRRASGVRLQLPWLQNHRCPPLLAPCHFSRTFRDPHAYSRRRGRARRGHSGAAGLWFPVTCRGRRSARLSPGEASPAGTSQGFMSGPGLIYSSIAPPICLRCRRKV